MKKSIILFIFVFLIGQAFALNFYSIEYTVQKGDDFASIIKKFVRRDAIINSKSPMIHKTRSDNPQIQNWRELKPGEKFKMFVTEDVIDMKKFEAYKKGLAQKQLAEKKRKAAEAARKKRLALRPSGLKASLFYMASAGNFTQTSSTTGVDIDFSQNSPYTFGLSALYYPEGKPFSYSASLYYSALSASVSNLNQEVDVPAELGLNLYLQHDLYKYKFSYYGGIDYESFSTFNTGLLATSNNIRIDENKVLYLTAGVAKLFKLGKIPLFTKLSLSKSLSTSTTPAPGGVQPTKEYSGIKVMGYLNYKFHRRWFAHTLVKYHTMSGPDDLSVLRYGLGFGYILK